MYYLAMGCPYEQTAESPKIEQLLVHWTRSDVRQEKSCLLFYAKFLQIHIICVPYVFCPGVNKNFLLIGSDSFQDDGTIVKGSVIASCTEFKFATFFTTFADKNMLIYEKICHEFGKMNLPLVGV